MKLKIIEKLKKLSHHKYVVLTSRGNSAIYIALSLAKRFSKGNLLIPDQAGWLTYKHYPKKLKLKVKVVKTDYGVIDLADLGLKLKEASALLYQNPAGYFAEQPSKDIYRLCKGKCIVITDVSGSVGTSMCNDSDISICSFGKWKPVNLGYGGFISFDNKKYIDFVNSLKERLFFDGEYTALYDKLNLLDKKYKFYSEINKKIKRDLKDFKIIHKNKKGINVVVKFNTEQEKEKIIKYCQNNTYEFVLCPKYIRVNEKAVSIEVKRLG